MKLLQESPVEFLEPLSRPPETVYLTEVRGKFGTAVLAGTPEGILNLRIDMPLSALAESIRSGWRTDKIIYDAGPFEEYLMEGLRGYLEGSSTPVRATVQPVMLTPFTVKVHTCLARIPFGETRLYGEIASEMGTPGAARAVGGACGRNRVLIIVPCHRVLASNGLGGFGAGIDMKRRLLEHENIDLGKNLTF